MKITLLLFLVLLTASNIVYGAAPTTNITSPFTIKPPPGHVRFCCVENPHHLPLDSIVLPYTSFEDPKKVHAEILQIFAPHLDKRWLISVRYPNDAFYFTSTISDTKPLTAWLEDHVNYIHNCLKKERAATHTNTSSGASTASSSTSSSTSSSSAAFSSSAAAAAAATTHLSASGSSSSSSSAHQQAGTPPSAKK